MYGLRGGEECRNAQQRAINIYQHIPKEEKQYSIIPVHLFSGEDKQCRKVQMRFFGPATWQCFLIKDTSEVMEHVFFYL